MEKDEEEDKKGENQIRENIKNLNSGFKSIRSRINFFESKDMKDKYKEDKDAIIGSRIYKKDEIQKSQSLPSRSQVEKICEQPYKENEPPHGPPTIFDSSANPFRNRNLNNQLNNLPPYNKLLLNGPAPNAPVDYLGIKQNQEQINLLRMILNSVNDNINRGIISYCLLPPWCRCRPL